jgi:predicted dehydrogenase
MKNKIKFGVIGCSRIAKDSVIPAIKNSEFAELQMIGSRSVDKAAEFARYFSCKNYGTYEEVIDNKNLDAVYVSVPVGLHEEWTIKAANAGKHVLCEKSSTVSYESAKRMVQTCKENNVRIMEGLMFRFHPQHLKVLELIQKRKLGDLFVFNGFYGFPPMSHDDIRYKKELGGGVFNDAGCYPICASRIIFGEEPTEVLCNFVMDHDSGVDSKATIFLKYGKTKFAQMAVGYDLFFQSTYSVWGSNGSVQLRRSYNIPPDEKAKLFLHVNTEIEEITIEPHNHFTAMVDSFCHEVTGSAVCSFNFEEDLLKQAKVMQAARISNDKQCFVKINEL